jgi:predicted regulator of Ras-like GTPase activity (Roadblock/LC7/MglB family)
VTGRPPITEDSFFSILEDMNLEGGFRRSVLATSEGLPIASAPMTPNHELTSAMIAMLQQVSLETQNQLDLTSVDEVTIRTEENAHLVCRTIPSGKDWVCLGVLVPPGRVYRRVTNKAVRRIREVIET